ncbi:selenium metabolism membrane protein YedE/FdhT [Virgibacillus siamensis]|uniref:selenium metabolism membrane protein YedE/FdhT n=1 Tax=Virgibacillus siamensis TaxID=480071 RepID=UPI000987222D|nr:selenium metabolism membrane protein YedE/FdhT [Virgibacillus siamensis]
MKGILTRTFQNYWNPYVALILAGALSALYFGLTGAVWAVTGEFTRLGGEFLQLFGVDISGWTYFEMIHMDGNTLTRPGGWMIWGMFIGALIMILLSNNFKFRIPRQKRRYIQGLAGGVLAGFGARLALGCNLAAFFTGVPQFSLHSWIFVIATGVGTFVGSKIVQTRWWKGKPALIKGGGKPSVQKTKQKQAYVGGIIAVLYAAVIVLLFAKGQTLLGFGALFGAFFGILIERGQICFTSAFRDLWIMARGVMAKAIIIGMALSSVMTIIVIAIYGMPPITQIAAPSTFVGGVLFGLGIVLASSCETGMMYRLMEGQVLYVTVFAGNIIGATFLAFAWDHLGIYKVLVASGSEINLISAIGPVGAITATLIMLAVAYMIVVLRENNYHKKYEYKIGGEAHVNRGTGGLHTGSKG